MKRINPDTGKPFVRGDTRADGFLFRGYNMSRKTKDGHYTEMWLSPERFECEKKRNVVRANAWAANNKEKQRSYCSVHAKRHPDKHAARSAKRRAAKLKRTPLWLTQEQLQQIESVYALAKQLTAETGVLHHVDHIVPLQGDNVSGLHVPWNLQVLPWKENIKKSNKWV